MPRKHRLSWLASALVGGLLSAVLVHPQPALAAPCWGTSCNGLDPQTTGCSASQTGTIEDFWWNGVHIELRLSGLCHAAWGRAQWNGPCNNNVAGNVWIEAYRDWQGNNWVASDYEPLPCNSNTTSWTAMLSFDYFVRAGIRTVASSHWTGLH